MKESDRERFGRLLTTLSELYERELSTIALTLYWRTLKDLPIELIERAADAWCRSGKFFPRPAELRELIESSPEDRALRAWELATEAHRGAGIWMSVAFEDPTIAPALKRVFGTWIGFAEFLHTASDEMIASKRKEFLIAYRNALKFGDAQSYLFGYHERENRETSGTWNRGPNGPEFEQPVYVVGPDGGRKVMARYDSARGELLSSLDELFSAPKLRVGRASAKALTDGINSEEEAMPPTLREGINAFLLEHRTAT